MRRAALRKAVDFPLRPCIKSANELEQTAYPACVFTISSASVCALSREVVMDIRTFRTLAGKNRYALFASACLIPASCMRPACGAGPQPEEVIVTGSRIRQSPVEATAPVQTTTAADIDRSGEVSI